MDTMQNFSSHRFPVFSTRGCVSSNNPFATKAGLDILQLGGNAVDAAVAVAAAMAVVEPSSTGLGGDAFCLYYNASEKKVYGLNGSGRCAAGLNLDVLAAEGFNAQNPLPDRHVHTVTVPGTAAAWSDAVSLFGSGVLGLNELLAPAISLAENGFPVTPVVANSWKKRESLLQSQQYGNELLLNGQAPRVAEIMKIPTMAESLTVLAQEGKTGFYSGRIGQAIVAEVQRLGGYLALSDLTEHTSTEVEPISVEYKNYTIWEIPPNGLGITTLMALNILEDYDIKALGHGSAEYFHLLIESLKLSFADSLYYVADPDIVSVPTTALLQKTYAAERRKLISMDKASDYPVHGDPDIKHMSDTVYMTAVDAEGNACSFINSNYMSFGTGIVPENCGFALQNRGALFTLDATKNNVLAPKKRPQHTIIPSMVTNSETGELLASYGIMGGFMQPQAQVQVLLSMVEFGMDPQQALDYPRFYVDVGASQPWPVSLEAGIQNEVSEALIQKGHNITWPVTGFDRGTFGRGHVITRGAWFAGASSDVYTGTDVWWAAADPRCDGYPQAY